MTIECYTTTCVFHEQTEPFCHMEKCEEKTLPKIYHISECELLFWHELTPEWQKEFDWVGAQEDSYFEHRKHYYHLGQFMRRSPHGGDYFIEDETGNVITFKYDGIHSESFFHAVVIILDPSGDFVTAADIFC